MQILNNLRKNKNLVLLAVIIIGGAMLRLFAISRYDLWFDEAITGLLLRNPHRMFSPTLFNAPLYYILLWLWVHASEMNELFMRLPSALAGTATIGVVYLTARHWLGTKTALLSALLLAISPFHIYYAQEARPYSTATFLYTATVLLFIKNIRLIKKIPAAYAVLILTMMTDYYAFVLIPILFTAQTPKRRHQIIVLSGCVCLFILPFLPYFHKCISIVTGSFFWIPYSTPRNLWVMLEVFTLGYNALGPFYVPATVCALILCAVSAARIRKQNPTALLCFYMFALPVAVFWLAGLTAHCFLVRKMLMFSPYYIILIADGFVRLWNRKTGVLAAILLVPILTGNAISLYFYFHNHTPRPPEQYDLGAYSKPSYKQAISFIGQNRRSSDIVTHSNLCSTAPFGFYTQEDKDYLFYLPPPEDNSNYTTSILTAKPNDKKNHFVQNIRNIKTFPWPRIWLVTANWNPNREDNVLGLEIKSILNEHYTCRSQQKFGSVWVYLLQRKQTQGTGQ